MKRLGKSSPGSLKLFYAYVAICVILILSEGGNFSTASDDSDEYLGLQWLYRQLRGTNPSGTSWLGVARLPSDVAVQLLSGEKHRRVGGTKPELREHNVVYVAYDARGKDQGYVVGHVRGSSAYLDLLYSTEEANSHTVEQKLLTAFQHDIEELGVEEATALCPIWDVDSVNGYLKLGFNPERVGSDVKEPHTSKTTSNIYWTVPLTNENGSDTFALERSGILEGVMIPKALESLTAKGIAPLPFEVEVVKASQDDHLTLQKAQDFVDRCPENRGRLTIAALPESTYLFIAKTKEPNDRVLGLAVARLEDNGTMVVPWLYVNSFVEGYATLLLAEEILKVAKSEKAQAGVLFLPVSAVPAWRSAFAAGFLVKGFEQNERSYLLTSDTNSFSRRQHYRAQQALECRLAGLLAQETGIPETVKALSTSEAFSRGVEACSGHRSCQQGTPSHASLSTTSDSSVKTVVSRPKLSAPAFSPKESTESTDEDVSSSAAMQISFACVLLLIHIFVVILLRYSRPATRRPEALNTTDAGVDYLVGGPIAANWEWQPPPERKDEMRSSELDDFSITALDSDSSTHASVSLQ